MNRRKSLPATAAASMAASGGIHLHVDLHVEPAKETEFVLNFGAVFQPMIKQQPGFVDVKLMKLRRVTKGAGSHNGNYRLLISFQTEEQRLQWVASSDHQKVWPAVESNLCCEKLSATLFDLV